MNPEYLQKYYYFERNHWWFLVREKIIRQQLNKSFPANAQLKILNVGAATGRSSQMLQEYGEVISVEIDPDTCIFLRGELGLTVVEGSVESLSFGDNVFDVVCAFDVIEHIEQQEQAINELFRVCKNNGVLYCTVPAFHFLWSTHDEVNQHKRRYTMKGIQEVVGHKFTVEYSTYFNALLFFPVWFTRTILQRLQKPQQTVSDFENSKILNRRFFTFMFKTIFSMELLWLRYFTFSFGVSILLRARKQSSSF
jgi:ubiquinone/menaquinone biosynthesis C-methylase UbiE